MVVVRVRSQQRPNVRRRFNSHAGIMVVVRVRVRADALASAVSFNSHAGIMVVVRKGSPEARHSCRRFQFPCGNYGRCKINQERSGNAAYAMFQFPCGNYGRCK